MTLKSLPQIKSCSIDELEEYINDLFNEGYNITLVNQIFSFLRDDRYLLPVSELSWDYLVSFLVDNPNIEASFFPADYKIVDGDVRLLSFTINDQRKFLFTTQVRADDLVAKLAIVSMGMRPSVVNREDLERDTDNFSTYKQFLIYLGIVEEGEEESQIPNIIPEVEVEEIDQRLARFSSAVWFEKIQEKKITLAGCGGIGSFVAFMLSRVNPNRLTLFDDDFVEEVNLAGQLFSTRNIGRKKVDAVASMLADFSKFFSTFAVGARFDENSPTEDIMICGFDNMEARKVFFQKWVDRVMRLPEEERAKTLFIDGRLAAEAFQVYCIRGDDDYSINKYRDECLFSDEEADETVCSYKQTTFMANMIGSIIVNLFTNFVANEVVPGLRDLPFLTYYEAASMILKTSD